MKNVDSLRMPLIGLTSGEVKDPTQRIPVTVHGQGYTYTNVIVNAGAAPVILPLTENQTVLRRLYETLDGILFAGGNDISPARYGQKPYPGSRDASELRDQVELTLMRWALEDHKPLLGICRGMQLLNVQQGGTLYQEISLDIPDASDHESSTHIEHVRHQLNVKADSALARFLQSNAIATNTHHHQAVKKLGKKLRVVARSEDGLIEAIELKNHIFAIGIQSHPESLAPKPSLNGKTCLRPSWQRLSCLLLGQRLQRKPILRPEHAPSYSG